MLLYSLKVDVNKKLQKINSSDFRSFVLALTDGLLPLHIWTKCDKEILPNEEEKILS